MNIDRGAHRTHRRHRKIKKKNKMVAAPRPSVYSVCSVGYIKMRRF